jgi:hypothetical protein
MRHDFALDAATEAAERARSGTWRNGPPETLGVALTGMGRPQLSSGDLAMSVSYLSVSTFATSGDAVDLFDDFYLSANVSFATTDPNGDGIVAGAGTTIGYVYGSIFAGHDGVDCPNGNGQIVVGATGTISAEFVGLAFGAGANLVENQGLISGVATGVFCKGGNDTIVNSGLIESAASGITFGVLITGGGNSITNSGTIFGEEGVAIGSAPTDGAQTIVNSGVIEGNLTGVITGNASTTVTNSGHIVNGVQFGSSYDTLINKGTITGNVVFGAGGAIANPTTGDFANYYDGTGGSVTGWIEGGSGDSDFTGGSGADRFDLSAGGTYSVFGGDGNDRFVLGANLFPDDMIDGGPGFDTVVLNGDYSAGLTFAATTMTDVERLVLKEGHSYNLTPNDATVAAGQTLIVDGSTLRPSDAITLNASRETDGSYDIRGGAGADTFLFTPAHFSASDLIQGGPTGSIDTLGFTTAGTIGSGAFANVSGIERIVLANGTTSVSIPDALVTSAANSSLTIVGGTGADTINASGVTTATNSVRLIGGAGADHLIAGGGAETFVYTAASDSTGPDYDTITGMNFAFDRFDVPGAPGTIKAINPAVTTGSLSTATFNANLAAAVGAAKLGPHDALLFTPSGGTLAGQTFLIADLNGTAGYQGNADLVVHLAGQTGTLTTANFV